MGTTTSVTSTAHVPPPLSRHYVRWDLQSVRVALVKAYLLSKPSKRGRQAVSKLSVHTSREVIEGFMQQHRGTMHVPLNRVSFWEAFTDFSHQLDASEAAGTQAFLALTPEHFHAFRKSISVGAPSSATDAAKSTAAAGAASTNRGDKGSRPPSSSSPHKASRMPAGSSSLSRPTPPSTPSHSKPSSRRGSRAGGPGSGVGGGGGGGGSTAGSGGSPQLLPSHPHSHAPAARVRVPTTRPSSTASSSGLWDAFHFNSYHGPANLRQAASIRDYADTVNAITVIGCLTLLCDAPLDDRLSFLFDLCDVGSSGSLNRASVRNLAHLIVLSSFHLGLLGATLPAESDVLSVVDDLVGSIAELEALVQNPSAPSTPRLSGPNTPRSPRTFGSLPSSPRSGPSVSVDVATAFPLSGRDGVSGEASSAAGAALTLSGQPVVELRVTMGAFVVWVRSSDTPFQLLRRAGDLRSWLRHLPSPDAASSRGMSSSASSKRSVTSSAVASAGAGTTTSNPGSVTGGSSSPRYRGVAPVTGRRRQRLRQRALETIATDDELILFAKELKFSFPELKKLRAQFAQKAYKHGEALGLEAFRDLLQHSLGSLGHPSTLERMFNVFDLNNDGAISFEEFLTGLSCVTRGRPEDKLQLMFEIYDRDGDGTLDVQELLRFVKESSHGILEWARFADELYATIDINGDGSVSREEFTTVLLREPALFHCFSKAVCPAFCGEATAGFEYVKRRSEQRERYYQRQRAVDGTGGGCGGGGGGHGAGGGGGGGAGWGDPGLGGSAMGRMDFSLLERIWNEYSTDAVLEGDDPDTATSPDRAGDASQAPLTGWDDDTADAAAPDVPSVPDPVSNPDGAGSSSGAGTAPTTMKRYPRAMTLGSFRQLMIHEFKTSQAMLPLIPRVFRHFDFDGNGRVSLNEFFSGVSGVLGGNLHHLADFYFDLYDISMSGFVETSQIVSVLFTLRRPSAAGKVYSATAPSQAPTSLSAFLAELDKDGDGLVTRDEFHAACQKDTRLLHLLRVMFGGRAPPPPPPDPTAGQSDAPSSSEPPSVPSRSPSSKTSATPTSARRGRRPSGGSVFGAPGGGGGGGGAIGGVGGGGFQLRLPSSRSDAGQRTSEPPTPSNPATLIPGFDDDVRVVSSEARELSESLMRSGGRGLKLKLQNQALHLQRRKLDSDALTAALLSVPQDPPAATPTADRMGAARSQVGLSAGPSSRRGLYNSPVANPSSFNPLGGGFDPVREDRSGVASPEPEVPLTTTIQQSMQHVKAVIRKIDVAARSQRANTRAHESAVRGAALTARMARVSSRNREMKGPRVPSVPVAPPPSGITTAQTPRARRVHNPHSHRRIRSPVRAMATPRRGNVGTSPTHVGGGGGGGGGGGVGVYIPLTASARGVLSARHSRTSDAWWDPSDALGLDATNPSARRGLIQSLRQTPASNGPMSMTSTTSPSKTPPQRTTSMSLSPKKRAVRVGGGDTVGGVAVGRPTSPSVAMRAVGSPKRLQQFARSPTKRRSPEPVSRFPTLDSGTPTRRGQLSPLSSHVLDVPTLSDTQPVEPHSPPIPQ